ncbi:MAG: WHG domain-containing protein [Clostridia bacterium]|nr:WHG domain-containing protein [Clostridia bacterium]MBQ6789463.1 WHG domain-containing protein [Clostridia bacterium]
MAPKVKITRDDIINTAVELVRKNGADSLNARSIASALACSTQPVFSNFSSMDEFRLAVVERADEICTDYIKREAEKGEFPVFKASGMAYISFAREEKELFKLLYMRDRKDEVIPESNELGDSMISVIRDNTGLKDEDVKLFHLEMWAYVHGLASMAATGFAELDRELVSRMLTDAYFGLRKQYGLE